MALQREGGEEGDDECSSADQAEVRVEERRGVSSRVGMGGRSDGCSGRSFPRDSRSCPNAKVMKE
jgi:hypothetical protein